DIEAALEWPADLVDVAREQVPLSEAHEQEGKVGVRLVVPDRRVRALQPFDRLIEPPLALIDGREPGGSTARPVRVATALVERDRLLEQRSGSVAGCGVERHLAGADEGGRLLDRAGGELGGALEVPLRLGGRPERRGPLACPKQAGMSPRAK